MSSEFVTFVKDLIAAVKHTDTKPSEFTRTDSQQVLDSIRQIMAAVGTEMARLNIDNATGEELEALIELNKLLQGLKAEERIRLATLDKFEAMSRGAGAVN